MDNEEIKKWPGLSDQEAKDRLIIDGHNEIPSQKTHNFREVIIHVLSEPMLFFLLLSGLVYLLIGEIKDTLMLSSCVIFIIGITIYQELKTEKTLQKLKDLSSPRVLVIRDGKRIRIPGRELVVGDIILLREGDRVPADARILSNQNLSVDESLLTGESIAVHKSVSEEEITPSRPGGDDLPFIYSGSLIISGNGIAKVIATGIKSEIGKIGKSIQSIKEEDTLLHRETEKIVKIFASVGLILCLLVIILYVYKHGDLLKGLLAGLTLSMSLLPEEFPVVLVIFLTLGAWRISKKQVLTRKSAAIETLGAATVLCVDKTGTLTKNRMTLSMVITKTNRYHLTDEKNMNLPESAHELIEYAYLASLKDPYDPVEKEIKDHCEKLLDKQKHLHRDWKLIKEYPLSKELFSLCHVWQSPDGKEYEVAAKGAPEAIFNLCRLSQQEKNIFMAQVSKMAENGLRILAITKACFNEETLPKTQQSFDFEFLGLIGFIDPVREKVNESLEEAYKAGIRVIMITGDYPGTAFYIAKQIGLKNYGEGITGAQLEKMDHQTLCQRIKTVNIFARVVPEQKLIIVNALKANGEIVAMTGDGVNDAPALKAAHIGIAMGERGTDVAREAASLVLLNDDFSAIVSAIRLGRRIFDNLRKAMGYIFSIHIPIAGLALAPIVLNFPPILFPAHIAFLELIIDPACSTVFEAEHSEKDAMKKPPRKLNEPLLSRNTILISTINGVSMLVLNFFLYVFLIKSGIGQEEVRTVTFIILVLSNLMLIIVNTSKSYSLIHILISPNKALGIILFGTIVALILAVNIPFLSTLFYFSTITYLELLITILAALIILIWFEITKISFQYLERKSNQNR